MKARKMLKRLGYGNRWIWSSTSEFHGYQGLPDTEGVIHVSRPGWILKTPEFGLLFVQDFEDVTGHVEAEHEKVHHP